MGKIKLLGQTCTIVDAQSKGSLTVRQDGILGDEALFLALQVTVLT